MSSKLTLDNLSLKKTYSLLLFVLFKLREVPEIAPLSQLVYLLDEDSLLKVLKYFGGQTVTFPTIKELEYLIYVLLLYEKVELKGEDFYLSLNEIPKDYRSDIAALYTKVKTIMEEYNFA